MGYYLESQSRPFVCVYMFGDYLKCRIRSFGIKHIPTYGICNEVGNLQSDDVVGFVLELEVLDSVRQSLRCYPFSACYTQSVVIFQQHLVLIGIAALDHY